MSKKIILNNDVLTETKKRVNYTFDNFENVYLSFSAGKDSTVMLHIVAEIAIKKNKKFGLLFIDLEAQYKYTIIHAKKCFEKYKNIITPFWVSLPIALRNAVSVYEPKWICWEQDKKDSWIRNPDEISITDYNYFPFYKYGMEFEEFAPAFGEWYSNNKLTACLVGIRADESLNRFRTINSQSKTMFNNKCWTTKVTDHVFNIYPIYDWKTEDIWTYHGKYPCESNELYDVMHKAGLTLSQMRICQPYGDDQRRGLWLFHLIEPETWAKIVYRVSGANSGALYIKEWGNVNGYRSVQKPSNHTWESFSKLILESMPEESKKQYEAKIFMFIRFWKSKGYPEGIPDEADHSLEVKRLAPSWRRIAKSLLRNDYWCKGLSFTQHKTGAYKKYLELIKKRMEKEQFEKTRQQTFI